MKAPLFLLVTVCACSLFCSVPSAPASDHAAYCAAMRCCLGETPPGCSEQDCTETDIPKTGSYCSIFEDLQKRGLTTDASQGRQIFRQVSGPHRVEYALTGTLPMPAAVMVYLMNDLPFSTQLVNAYQKTAYQASYLDASRKRFAASSENVSGVFTTVLKNEEQTSALYYGFGTVEILAWRLSGTALVLLDFEETGVQEITYTVRCMVFPHNAFVKSILNFILFRKAVINVLDRTFRSVQDSAMAFHRGRREPITHYPAFQTPEGRQQIDTFQQVLHTAMQEMPAPAAPAAQPEDQH